MKSLTNDMAATSKKLEDEEIASYILAGLDMDYNLVLSSMTRRTEPLTLDELYTQLVSWEQRIDLQNGGSGSSTNSASCDGRGSFQHGRGGHSAVAMVKDAATAAMAVVTSRTPMEIALLASFVARKAIPSYVVSSALTPRSLDLRSSGLRLLLRLHMA